MAPEMVDLSENSVAYFDKGVEAAGFYLLEGEPSESVVRPTSGDQFYDEDGEPVVLENGRMAVGHIVDGEPVLGTVSTGEEITVKHESNMTPGTQVFPGVDGFYYKDPNGGES